ncbi:unnamed protein product [Prunus armeniaca]
MEMRIAAREKLGYRTSDASQPSKLSSTYSKWCTENFRVKGWLIDPMSPDLISRFICLSTAKEIWDVVKKTYFGGGDRSMSLGSQELDFRGMCIRFEGMCLGIWIRGFEDLDLRDLDLGKNMRNLI